MLELVFSNSFFVFDGKIYQQMIGLFLGCKPSPIGAIVRVYTFERRSVYTDLHYLPVMYGRYVDDAGTVTSDEERANQLFDRIAGGSPVLSAETPWWLSAIWHKKTGPPTPTVKIYT